MNLLTKVLFILVSSLFLHCTAHELYVLHPSSLANKFQVDGMAQKGLVTSSIGNFGFYDKHSVFRGRVHYPIDNQDGCNKFEESHFDHNHLKEGSFDGHRLIIMVDRGNCHFVKKVRNIQQFGAVMAIIVDDHRRIRTRMSDDGQGGSIKIPSFLISRDDGKAIKEAIHQMDEERIKNLSNEDWAADNVDKDSHESRNFGNTVKDRKEYKKRNHQVIMQAIIQGKMSKADTINVDLWYSNIYELYESKWNFLNLARMQDIFDSDGYAQSTVNLQPRSLFLSSTGPNIFMLNFLTGDLCIMDGKYCGELPITLSRQRDEKKTKEEKSKYSMKAVVQQTLREQCVFQSLSNSKSHWFIYIKQLIDLCVVEYSEEDQKVGMKMVTQDCHDALINHPSNQLNIDKVAYKKCVKNQWKALEDNKDKPLNYSKSTSFLDRDYMVLESLGQSPLHPSFTLNNISFEGDLKNPNDLFKKVCSLMEKRPPQCQNLTIFNTKDEILKEYEQEWGKTGSIERRIVLYKNFIETIQKEENEKVVMERKAGIAEIFLSFVVLFILTCFILLYCQLYRKNNFDDRMIQEVNQQVSQYFQLAANDTTESSRTRVSDPDQN